MRKPPSYFERIRRAAERRWDQLEADAGLAGPWWQLFRQVQSPSHVLSELLQNADDAGATDASATIENRCLVFRHNGKDLTEEDLESLCNFGFSNKRRLLTIGFRGVGFRSTFSLGPSVQVVTPTLGIRFDRKRFTHPVWIKDAATSDQTTIRVEIADAAKLKAIRASIARWKHGALPLVFFRAVQRLQLEGEDLCAERRLDGPCERRDTLRRYLTSGFFKHHLQMYKRRPIYWLFASGKQRAFQCLVYLHRYNEGTLSRMRTEYVIPLQGKVTSRIDQLASDIQKATSTSHRKKLEKERDTLLKQQKELLAFDEKLRHYADQRISLDLDDGVKVNYGKFGDLLAEAKAVTGSAGEE